MHCRYTIFLNKKIDYSFVHCPTGTAFDELKVNERTQNGAPATYTAKTSITFESGFETTTNDNFVTDINPEAAPCDVASERLAAVRSIYRRILV
jgi:hypothetical protein